MDSTDPNVSGLLTHRETADERVTGILDGATANGIVIAHVTQGALAASVFTRILAPLVQASSALLAVRVHQTLGPTAGRSSEISGETGAGGLLAKLTADAIGPTRRGLAGFHAFCRNVIAELLINSEWVFNCCRGLFRGAGTHFVQVCRG